MGDFSDRAFAVVRQVPAGRVATYGQVARMMGSPRSARYVGFALRSNPSPAAEGGAIPCHRIVFADGRLCSGFAFGGPGVQRALLESEGVPFLPDGRVNLEACQWTATPATSADVAPATSAVPTAPPPDFGAQSAARWGAYD